MDLDEHIARVAEARRSARDAASIAQAANAAQRRAVDQLESAESALRKAMERRINDLDPDQKGFAP